MASKKSKILGLILLLYSVANFAQVVDSAFVTKKNQEISMLRYEGKLQQAYDLSEQFTQFLEQKSASPKFLAESYFTKSRIEIELGKYSQAYQNFTVAQNLFSSLNDSMGLAKVYNIKGVYYYYDNNLDSTLFYYKKSFEIKKKKDFSKQEMAVSAYNLAMVYEDVGVQDKAMELYLEAEKYLKANTEFTSFLPDVYIGIAHIYKYKSEYANAEKYAEKAYHIGLESYGEWNPNMTFIYISYANILRIKKKYKEAIALIEKTVKIREDNYGENHRWTCESYKNLGEVYDLDEQYQMAEKYFKKAIDVGLKNDLELYLAYSYQALARSYINRKIKGEEATELIKKAERILKNIYGDYNDIVAEIYTDAAENALNFSRKDVFFKFIEKAKKASEYDADNLKKTTSPFQALNALNLEGDWYLERYKLTQEISYLEKKYALLDEQLALNKLIQENFSSEISRIAMANDSRDIFEDGLNTCWALYHQTEDKKYIEKAFELSETNRNTSLLEGLQDSKFKLYSGIPEDLLELEQQIKQDLTRTKMNLYYEKTSAKPDKKYLKTLLDDRIRIGGRLDSLHFIFEKNYPKYTNLKYQDKVINIEDVQEELDDDTQLITYFLGDENLYSFNVTKNNVTLLKGNVAEALVNGIGKIKDHLIRRNDLKSLSNDLYLYLINQQLDRERTKVVIIPDHVLNYIPFEILADKSGRYLIQDYTISYSGSARLYLELKNDYFNYENPNYWIGFSPTFFGNQTVSAANNEVTEISKILKGEYLTGEASKKENFYKHKDDYSILHLATHATIDHENPLYNKLVFSDGHLTSAEIYDSKIKANLAVLSACNTGFGKLEKGEGVMSMARAFNYAGVPSVLMSLWKVPDKETKKIMINFYKFLNQGMSKSEALQRAKILYLSTTQDDNLKHPFYWSGFVLNGNTVALKQSQNKYLLAGGILVVFGAIFLIIKKRGLV